MSPSVEIAKANPEDARFVAPLFNAYRVFYGQASDPELAYEFLRQRLTREESVVFLAFEVSTGIGFMQLYPSFSSVSACRLWILYDLFVAPEVRGRGVARALLEEARRFAAGTGAARLVLATAPDNVAAQKLYESAGWKRDVFVHYYLNV